MKISNKFEILRGDARRIISSGARNKSPTSSTSGDLLKKEKNVLQWLYAAIAQLVERIHGKDEVPGFKPRSRLHFFV